MKQTKFEKVRSHLVQTGSITSWEAIQLYRVTRLAAIIHLLKKHPHNMDITSERKKSADGTPYALYTYKMKEVLF